MKKALSVYTHLLGGVLHGPRACALHSSPVENCVDDPCLSIYLCLLENIGGNLDQERLQLALHNI
jgi:hypothetical protein